jgi:hypothetical protein
MSATPATWLTCCGCAACPPILGVTGGGIMLMLGDIPRGSLCTADPVSHLIEDLQYTLGERPCVDACERDVVVAEPDLADPVTRRWPVFTLSVLQAGSGRCSGSRCGPGRCASGRSASAGACRAR